MLDTRLTLALDGGGLSLPETGRIAVFGPQAGLDLAGLPPERTDVIQGLKPVYDQFAALGFKSVVAPETEYSMSIICLPRAKVEAHAMIAEACAVTDGPVVVDGQKTDGVDSVLRDLKRSAKISSPIAKAHGKLFCVHDVAPKLLVEWKAGPVLTSGGFWTAPGVFSADGIDPASALLADILPHCLGRTVADLGAGWGFLSAHILTRAQVKAVHLVEAGHMALECARHNVTDDRAQFHWADATTWTAPEPVDTVVMNPPFHTGRKAEPALGQAFLASAARILTPQGQLWMVANRHLPYETTLSELFGSVDEIGGDARFKLLHATRPLRKRR